MRRLFAPERRLQVERDQAILERDEVRESLASLRSDFAATVQSQMLLTRPSDAFPSHQAAINLFKGAWVSAMPKGSGLAAGYIEGHFGRYEAIEWAAEQLGGFNGKTLLDLGPFEGYLAYHFEALGVENITAIENSPANFLKCLIIKNIFSLRTTFLLGDFIKFLESSPRVYDICWASGVLYHMTDPIRFLQAVSRVSDGLHMDPVLRGRGHKVERSRGALL